MSEKIVDQLWVEQQKLEFDVSKHLTTLNTGTILIISTLATTILKEKIDIQVFLYSLASFLFSIVLSFIHMTLLTFSFSQQRKSIVPYILMGAAFGCFLFGLLIFISTAYQIIHG